MLQLIILIDESSSNYIFFKKKIIFTILQIASSLAIVGAAFIFTPSLKILLADIDPLYAYVFFVIAVLGWHSVLYKFVRFSNTLVQSAAVSVLTLGGLSFARTESPGLLYFFTGSL